MGARTGAQFLEGLRRTRREIWVDGERVSGFAEIKDGSTLSLGPYRVEVTTNGGSFSLTKAYTKYSPEFSGAGQDSNTIFDQCLRNYLPSWVGVELQNWVDANSGLKAIENGIKRVAENLGLDATTMVDTDITAAPTTGGMRNPTPASTPAATGRPMVL